MPPWAAEYWNLFSSSSFFRPAHCNKSVEKKVLKNVWITYQRWPMKDGFKTGNVRECTFKSNCNVLSKVIVILVTFSKESNCNVTIPFFQKVTVTITITF